MIKRDILGHLQCNQLSAYIRVCKLVILVLGALHELADQRGFRAGRSLISFLAVSSLVHVMFLSRTLKTSCSSGQARGFGLV